MAEQHDDGDNRQDEVKIRRRRNIVLALVLGALVILFFLMTMVRIGGHYG